MNNEFSDYEGLKYTYQIFNGEDVVNLNRFANFEGGIRIENIDGVNYAANRLLKIFGIKSGV